MTEIKDWKGNEVKDGDEICFIATKKNYMFSTGYWLVPGDPPQKIPMDLPPPEDCWIVGDYHKVFIMHGELYTTITSGNFTLTDALVNTLLFVDRRYTILAIKGISDKK